jgi:hypothetical protein
MAAAENDNILTGSDVPPVPTASTPDPPGLLDDPVMPSMRLDSVEVRALIASGGLVDEQPPDTKTRSD